MVICQQKKQKKGMGGTYPITVQRPFSFVTAGKSVDKIEIIVDQQSSRYKFACLCVSMDPLY